MIDIDILCILLLLILFATVNVDIKFGSLCNVLYKTLYNLNPFVPSVIYLWTQTFQV